MKSNYNPKTNTTAVDISFTAIQFLILLLFIISPNFYTFNFPKFIFWIGFALILLGLIVFFIAVFTLRKSLSLYPTPTPNAELITHGIYKFIRHPIYTGLLIFLLGISLFFAGISRFILLLITIVLFVRKANYEEERLIIKFKDYKKYKEKTGKFLPKI